jgi:hypothetical protein
MEGSTASIPLGIAGRLEAEPLSNARGNHAMLVREGEQPRALLTAEPGDGERERLVIVPLDEVVQLRVDGDALAVWLADGSATRGTAGVPMWANAIGFVLVIAVVGFAVLGSVTFFGWLFRAAGWL